MSTRLFSSSLRQLLFCRVESTSYCSLQLRPCPWRYGVLRLICYMRVTVLIIIVDYFQADGRSRHHQQAAFERKRRTPSCGPFNSRWRAQGRTSTAVRHPRASQCPCARAGCSSNGGGVFLVSDFQPPSWHTLILHMLRTLHYRMALFVVLLTIQGSPPCLYHLCRYVVIFPVDWSCAGSCLKSILEPSSKTLHYIAGLLPDIGLFGWWPA